MIAQVKFGRPQRPVQASLKSRNFWTLAAVGAAAGVSLFMTPGKAIQATMAFCGFFMDGGKIDGWIKVDTMKPDPIAGAVIDFQAVTSTAAPGSIINWTENNFVTVLKNVQPNLTDNPNIGNLGGGVSRQYKFAQGLTELYINIPEVYFPENFPLPSPPTTGIPYMMAEYRDGIWRKDPDKLRAAVPGPLPLFAVVTGFGFARKARSMSKRLHAVTPK